MMLRSNVPWPMAHPATWSRGAHVTERKRQNAGAALERARCVVRAPRRVLRRNGRAPGQPCRFFNGSLITGEETGGQPERW